MPQSRTSLARGSLRRRPLLALVILILLLVVGYATQGLRHHSSHPPATVSLTSLPAQARDTVALIERHGPYPYPEDGTVYSNFGRQLPPERSGYYHEYTVVTPGAADRGDRRIITGSAGQYYYTGDHYLTFQRINLNQ